MFFLFCFRHFPCGSTVHLNCYCYRYKAFLLKAYKVVVLFLSAYCVRLCVCEMSLCRHQDTPWETFLCLIVKALFVYFDSKCVCTFRIICYLESRIRSLSVLKCKVLWERNLFVIFERKIDQPSWRDSNNSCSTKFEGISLKILVIGIQVVAVIKRKSLLLFKSIILVLTLFEIYQYFLWTYTPWSRCGLNHVKVLYVIYFYYVYMITSIPRFKITIAIVLCCNMP